MAVFSVQRASDVCWEISSCKERSFNRPPISVLFSVSRRLIQPLLHGSQTALIFTCALVVISTGEPSLKRRIAPQFISFLILRIHLGQAGSLLLALLAQNRHRRTTAALRD